MEYIPAKGSAEEFINRLFHKTPPQRRELFVAHLLTIWGKVRGEEISNIKLGAVEHEKGVLGFMAAVMRPLDDSEPKRLIPLGTIKRQATTIRDSARKFGEEHLFKLVQIVN